jgi:hypothetical protein
MSNIILNTNDLNIYLEKNRLYVILKNNQINETIFNDCLSCLESFYKTCKKKNISFYSIFDFNKVDILNLSILIYYVKKTGNFLNKYKEFYKTNLIKTIIISDSGIGKKVFEIITATYTSTRPVSFISSTCNILNEFND